MTAGERKINATGRSTGQIKTHRKNKIVGQFSARTIEMLRSPAYRTLSLSARRVLDRVEIEHADHGGLENGRLPVLFDDFQSYGIDRHSIAPAIRECVALGFLEITEIGRAGNAEYRRPNKFRLTYIHAPAGLTPTHDWARFEDDASAKAAAQFARQLKSKSQWGKIPNVGGGKPTTNATLPVGETPTTVMVEKPPLLSISPVERETWQRLSFARPKPASAPVGSAEASGRTSGEVAA